MKAGLHFFELKWAQPMYFGATRRRGILITLETSGRVIYGEASSLDFEADLSFRAAEIAENLPAWLEFLESDPPLAKQLDFIDNLGLECCIQACFLQLGLEIQEVFDTGFSVDVNQLYFGSLKTQEPGGTIIKIKINGDTDKAELLNFIRLFGKDIQVRLDANQSLSYGQAHTLFKLLQPVSSAIEYIEEPCRGLTLGQFDQLNGLLPIALDESILQYDLDRLPAAPVFILKPSLLGTHLWSLLELASNRRPEPALVFTSSFESSVGLHFIANLASIYGSKNHAHGLATAGYFAQDSVMPALVAQNDKISIEPQHFTLNPGVITGSHAL